MLVAVAEDDPDVVYLLEAVLSDSGYAVATTDNGADALTLVQERHPTSCCSTSGCPDASTDEVCAGCAPTTSSPHSRSCCSPHTPGHATSRPVSRRGRTPTCEALPPWRSGSPC